MAFNSYEFIGLLPIMTGLYYFLSRYSHRLGKLFLTLFSLFLYSYAGIENLYFILISLILNYLFAILIRKYDKKLFIYFSVLVNIIMLVSFKYNNFSIFKAFSVFRFNCLFSDVIIPLGISFITFQQIDFLLHISKTKKIYNFLDYTLTMTYYPKLIQGPITKFDFLVSQFLDETRKNMDFSNILHGIVLFTLGLSKKVLLADTFGSAVMWGFSNYQSTTCTEIIIIIISYTFQIYFDFSGYSDMALGVSKMLNIDLPINFDSPYKAYSILDFWRRWHISLTSFFRENIYFPLGGSRKGKYKTYINIFIVYCISGFWHGAGWNYILWGALQGLACILNRIFEKCYSKLNPVFQWMMTFSFINVSWLLFRTESINQFIYLINKLLKYEWFGINAELLSKFALPEIEFFVNNFISPFLDINAPLFIMIMFFFVSLYICLNFENNYKRKFSVSIGSITLISILFVWSVLSLNNMTSFIYFDF